MGCDIHLFTERKKTINQKERWINIDNWKLNSYFGEYEGEAEYEISSAYRGRNYSLFSLLADVRSEDVDVPVSPPKGLPDDVSDAIKKESDVWGIDGHSHSYLTMGELYEHLDKNPTIRYSGLVDENGVEAIKNGFMPEWWCQGSNRPLTRMEWEHENTVLKDFINTLEEHFESEYYDRATQSEMFRIVFWFDN